MGAFDPTYGGIINTSINPYVNYINATKSGNIRAINAAGRKLLTTQKKTTNTIDNSNSGNQYFDSGTDSSNQTSKLSDFLGQWNSQIDEYTNELKQIAQGNYDFAAKWIENEFKTALGTNDVERANFLKQVANSLESEIGTIAYDYQTGTYRTNQDKQLALKRLSEDEATAKQDLGYQAGIAKEEQMANLNQRGLVTGPREQTVGLGSKFVNQLDTEIANKLAAIERVAGRGKEDVNLNSTRQLEDLTTQARRSGQGAIAQRDYGLESAKRAQDEANRKAEIEKSSLRRFVTDLSDYA